MLRRCVALLVVAVAGWLVPSAARACSCLPPPPPEEAFDNAAAVFEGRRTSVAGEGMQLRFSFDVARVWKGEVGAQTEIHTASDSAACGRNFVAGQTYLIYAYRGPDGRLGDGLCSRTRETTQAQEDLAVLGPGRELGGSADADDEPDPAREPPRIDAPAADPTPPPTEPNPRGCAVENAHTLERRGLLLLVGAGIAIRRRRVVRSSARPSHRSLP